MSEVDDLQCFITDCEWKTRKILRESNKRMKDNARTFAAKERVEKLKHGTNRKPSLTSKVVNSPLVNKSKSLNRSLPLKSIPPTTKKPITPVKEWKGRDKIIHDAVSTIKSFPVDKSSYKASATVRKENQQTGKAQTVVHSSLSASPFCGPKGKPGSVSKSKQKSRSAGANVDDDGDDDSPGNNGEPAMVTRRTIERDFYIMSKKRNTPSTRRQRSKKSEPPELKTSVLRKHYRCDERIMESKKKRAERLYEKLKRLKIPNDESDDVLSGTTGGDYDSNDSDSSDSSDEEEYVHAMHDLVERHLSDENARSLRRSTKLLMSSTFKPNVNDFWAHLQQSDGGTAIILSRDGQVPSVPLHIATKKFDLSTGDMNDIGENDSWYTSSIDHDPARRYISPYTEGKRDAPLSMRILGCSPYSNIVCPGHASIGKRGVWRLSDPVTDDSSDSMFHIWPSLMDTKYPESLDKSQASAFFQYKNLGPQKGNCITVLNSLAFESPVLAPYCFAVDKGYIAPPFSEHELVTGIIPHVHLPCTSLLENPVESRLDTLLPPPVVVLDPGASEDDWKDAPRNADGNVYHCREFNEFDGDGFRIKASARVVEYDNTISSVVYGISETAASPNHPTISSFFTHISHETCTQPLSRKRIAADYHYIAESDGEGTLSEPYLFATHMSAYSSVFVSRKSISSYREQERFLHAAKEAERKKRDLAFKMKAAEELVEERLKERIARIEHAVKEEEELARMMSENSVAVELPSSEGDSSIQVNDGKIPCDVELPTPSSEHLDYDTSEGDELEQLASLLLKNNNFLKAVARKLDISEEQIKQIDSTTNGAGHGNDLKPLRISNPKKNDMFHKDENGHSVEGTVAEHSLHQNSPFTSATTAEPKNMPKLMLNCKRYRDNNHTRSRGDGWKRLPRSETIIGDFSLTKRNVQKGIGGPKFNKLEDNRNFIAVNAVQELRYQPDPQQFETEPKSIFIPDLTTERLRLAKTYRQQKKTKESMLSMSQQQSLDEILQIPVSKTSEKAVEENDNGTNLDDDNDDECDETPLKEEAARPIDHVSRAILAVKNHNLPELEQVLDTEGLSVETRDQHGNSLLVLACQQGSKKLAKFLLRRGANMNAQNNGGNTALHYLYEYKHVSLAEYLIRKGADDSIKNGEGLTVYEGLQPD